MFRSENLQTLHYDAKSYEGLGQFVVTPHLASKKTTKRNKNIILRTYKADWTLLSYITQKGQIFKK